MLQGCTDTLFTCKGCWEELISDHLLSGHRKSRPVCEHKTLAFLLNCIYLHDAYCCKYTWYSTITGLQHGRTFKAVHLRLDHTQSNIKWRIWTFQQWRLKQKLWVIIRINHFHNIVFWERYFLYCTAFMLYGINNMSVL